jgi:hypothetical protein
LLTANPYDKRAHTNAINVRSTRLESNSHNLVAIDEFCRVKLQQTHHRTHLVVQRRAFVWATASRTAAISPRTSLTACSTSVTRSRAVFFDLWLSLSTS